MVCCGDGDNGQRVWANQRVPRYSQDPGYQKAPQKGYSGVAKLRAFGTQVWGTWANQERCGRQDLGYACCQPMALCMAVLPKVVLILQV